MVLSTELYLAIAQPIASAISDIQNPDARFMFRNASKQPHQRSAHAAESQITLGARVNGLIGGDHGLFRNVGQQVQQTVVLANLADPLRHQAQNLVDSQGTGNLSGSSSAHAVANDIDSVLYGISKSVFIGCALAARSEERRVGKERRCRW